VSILESLRTAFNALRANKLRTLLTMLGVIIGVGAVIIMISIVQGARQRVVSEFQGDGASMLFAVYEPKRDRVRRGGFEGLRVDDVRAIEQRVGSIKDVTAQVETGGRALRGKKSFQMTVVGCTPRYIQTANVKMAAGRFIDEDDRTGLAKVCILGDKVREELFEEKEDPVGQTVVLSVSGVQTPFTVIGTLQKKGRNGFGPSQDQQVFAPLESVQKRLTGSDIIASVSMSAQSGISPETAADEVFAVLKQRHPDRVQDFIVDTQMGLIQRLDSVLLVFQLILGGVAGLSLLVGGIGIMNIMLVSVTERTREIGIRKAVGAKQRDLLFQFITESMTVSGLGGLLGVGWGYSVATLIGTVAKEQMPTYVPLWAAVLGFTFAVSVGMFFGIYPAVRAARLDPINALRYE
jgi:putative ABC transport system permease protein